MTFPEGHDDRARARPLVRVPAFAAHHFGSATPIGVADPEWCRGRRESVPTSRQSPAGSLVRPNVPAQYTPKDMKAMPTKTTISEIVIEA
ncbi:Uncharacterised protein [Gordonia paraffinivorans]|uniref:Uncharacterized protein n=1 Tax=Gordonia paraffinivorans TaxID=175628 RepID=A0ABD7V1Y2_9ACTN|nr:Uncharacterised protein [Gordonia paraffinivorans]